MKNRNYFDLFPSWSDVVECFGGDCPKKQPKYVYARYKHEFWSGSADVIVSDDGRVFAVVEGSHCSCYGLEGQWTPTMHGRREMSRMTCKDDAFDGDAPNVRKWLQHIRMSQRRAKRLKDRL